METTIKHRMTRQRKGILEELGSRKDHPTADELYDVLRDRISSISLSTVYRNLDVLVSQGVVRVLEYPGMPRRYDADVSHHFHFRCIECNRVEDLSQDESPDISALSKRMGKRKVISLRIEYEGLCEECARVTEGDSHDS